LKKPILSKPHIFLAAGGTGGHIFPAEALAIELISRGYRLSLLTDKRGIKLSKAVSHLGTHAIRSGGVSGKGLLGKTLSLINISIGFIQALFLCIRLKPQIVVGFGGYASVPAMLAGLFCRINLVIHEQNAVLGRANRLFVSRAKKLAVSYEKCSHVSKILNENIVFTGLPLRPSVFMEYEVDYPILDPKSKIMLSVFGGSQGATVFSDIVPSALSKIEKSLRSRIMVTHQSRPEDIEKIKIAYRNIGIEADVQIFFNDAPKRIALSHLVICRAGASTIAELSAIGRPAILVPYKYAVDDHQFLNAKAYEETGSGWLIKEDNFTSLVLEQKLTSLFTDQARLKAAQLASRKFGKREASSKIAKIIDKLIDTEGSMAERQII
jgi:UDP-N-acetylglucosamine--N-acetylmuramyl-(pentapeptide) pyrophosphoryl-undecaprenol N-acetylglucosamine transferase